MNADDEPPADGRDVRVRELLQEGPREELDPATIARLAAWFGGPAAAWDEATGAPGEAPDGDAVAEPPAPAPAPDDLLEQQIRARRLSRDRALAAVEPALLEALEDQGRRAGAVLRDRPPVTSTIDPGIARCDLSAWTGAEADGPLERERPEDIYDALREQTPQALLRDLHRPERHYGGVVLLARDLQVDLGGEAARRLVRGVMGERYRADPSRQPLASALMAEAFAELAAQLRQPWDQLRPERPRRTSMVPGADDMRWFGAGGYDPDQ